MAELGVPRRRPKSSFLWLQSPVSLVRHGIRWRPLLWIGLGLAAFLLLLGLHSFFLLSKSPRAPHSHPWIWELPQFPSLSSLCPCAGLSSR